MKIAIVSSKRLATPVLGRTFTSFTASDHLGSGKHAAEVEAARRNSRRAASRLRKAKRVLKEAQLHAELLEQEGQLRWIKGQID